jgi:hypothetical protein
MSNGSDGLAVMSDGPLSGRPVSDPLLRGVLTARSETEREAAVAELLAEHAYDRIRKILSSRFRRAGLDADQVDDLRHEVIVRLVSRLRRLVRFEDDPIESFPDYVATATFNAFEDFVRKSHPLRSKLRNRTLYALVHAPGLAVWSVGGVSVCGLEAWRGRAPDEESPMPRLTLVGSDLRPMLQSLFARSAVPRTLEDVVSFLSVATGIPRDEAPRPLEEVGEIRATTADPIAELTNLQYLRTLWKEIRELPLRQRIALLLQARDAGGESVTHLLPVTGIATIREIAEALEMGQEEFASLWRGLPFDDLTLAKRFDVTRQQVINLRRAARSRLLRRMGELRKGSGE